MTSRFKDGFRNFLIEQGYKEVTPSGNTSTVCDYVNRIEKITTDWENITWEELAENIDNYVLQYDIGGTKQNLGEKSHRSFINALKRFKEYIILNNNLKNEFRNFLIEQGYKEVTPLGKPSTVYDYVNRIEKITHAEKIDWNILAKNIDNYVLQYDIGGTKQDLGRTSHNSVINALKRFKEYVTISKLTAPNQVTIKK